MHKLYATREKSSDPDHTMVGANKGLGNIREGFTYRSVDLQTGVISPMEILHLITNCRCEFFLNIIPARFPCFTLANDVSFSRDAYKILKAKLPITVETELATIGRSTLLIESKLFLSDRAGKPLFVGRESFVAVDLASRKSTPLPKYFVDIFKDLKDKQNDKMPSVLRLNKPNESQCQGVPSKPFIIHAKRRNLDINGHVNILYFIEYCIDALEIHLQQENVLCEFDTGCLQVKRIQYGAKGESNMGDILHVAFWDDKVDKSTVCFDISRSGKTIFQARMEFYNKDDPGDVQSKL